jgi:hypothetical protein
MEVVFSVFAPGVFLQIGRKPGDNLFLLFLRQSHDAHLEMQEYFRIAGGNVCRPGQLGGLEYFITAAGKHVVKTPSIVKRPLGTTEGLVRFNLTHG